MITLIITIYFSLLTVEKDGQLVNIIIGTNAPRLMQLIVEELEQYVKFKNGEVQKEFVSIYILLYNGICILHMDTKNSVE